MAISMAGDTSNQSIKRDGSADARHMHASRKCGAHWDYNGQSYQYHYIQC